MGIRLEACQGVIGKNNVDAILNKLKEIDYADKSGAEGGDKAVCQ